MHIWFAFANSQYSELQIILQNHHFQEKGQLMSENHIFLLSFIFYNVDIKFSWVHYLIMHFRQICNKKFLFLSVFKWFGKYLVLSSSEKKLDTCWNVNEFAKLYLKHFGSQYHFTLASWSDVSTQLQVQYIILRFSLGIHWGILDTTTLSYKEELCL